MGKGRILRNLATAFIRIRTEILFIVTNRYWANSFAYLFLLAFISMALCLMGGIFASIIAGKDYLLSTKSWIFDYVTVKLCFVTALRFALCTLGFFVSILPAIIQQSIRKMAPTDHGVNWKRDGF